MEKVGIILLNYCNYNLTIDCIKSIRQSTYQNYEIIVVDNNSPDHSGENLSQLEGIRFLQKPWFCSGQQQGNRSGFI